MRFDNDAVARVAVTITPITPSATTGGLAVQGKPQGLVAGIVHFF